MIASRAGPRCRPRGPHTKLRVLHEKVNSVGGISSVCNISALSVSGICLHFTVTVVLHFILIFMLGQLPVHCTRSYFAHLTHLRIFSVLLISANARPCVDSLRVTSLVWIRIGNGVLPAFCRVAFNFPVFSLILDICLSTADR